MEAKYNKEDRVLIVIPDKEGQHPATVKNVEVKPSFNPRKPYIMYDLELDNGTKIRLGQGYIVTKIKE